MASPFRSKFRKVKLFKPQHEFEEFGKAKKGLLICKKCNIFYYKKSWHHKADAFITQRENKDLPVKFVLCPACQMIKNHQHEGEMVLKNVPARLKTELINFINGFGRRAYFRNPLNRVIDIKPVEKNLIITTTENEMAVKLSNKIKNHFRGVKAKIVYTKAPSDLVRITIEWQ